MTLNFPSRFFKKLDIYQQIRTGQGISKYKRLWKYEAAFLQYSYEKGHQHLSNFVSRSNFKKWIEYITPFNPKQDEKELSHVIANLFWRGYIDVVERVNDKKINKDKVGGKGLPLFDRSSHAFKSSEFGDESSLDYRTTAEGLLIGEVLSEINNKNKLLKSWNRYKYNWVLDTVWLVIFWGIVQIFFSDVVKGLSNFKIRVGNLQLNYIVIVSITIIAGWPLLSWIYRKTYSFFEKSH